MDIARLVMILEGEKQIRLWKAHPRLRDRLPMPSTQAAAPEEPYVLSEMIEILSEAPFPIIVHKDPPPGDPPILMKMISAARVICTQNLEYLDALEKEYEIVP